jgi:hypothetical protein
MWEEKLPKVKGVLRSGTPMPRTDPSSAFDVSVLILGVYPAATRMERMVVGGIAMRATPGRRRGVVRAVVGVGSPARGRILVAPRSNATRRSGDRHDALL